MIRKESQKGFTIIEVVLVLAIAALIFLIVFLAVPALQRSQRDTQRRSDVGRLATSITNYAGNHQGELPTTVDRAYLTKYLRISGDSFKDPTKGDYVMVTGSTTVPALTDTFASPAAANMYYMPVAKCNTNGTFAAANTRNFAVSVILESGDIYCQDS